MDVSSFVALIMVISFLLIPMVMLAFFEDKDKKRRQKEYFQNLEYTLSKVLNDYSEQFNLEENDK